MKLVRRVRNVFNLTNLANWNISSVLPTKVPKSPRVSNTLSSRTDRSRPLVKSAMAVAWRENVSSLASRDLTKETHRGTIGPMIEKIRPTGTFSFWDFIYAAAGSGTLADYVTKSEVKRFCKRCDNLSGSQCKVLSLREQATKVAVRYCDKAAVEGKSGAMTPSGLI